MTGRNIQPTTGPVFDYELVDPDTAESLQAIAADVRALIANRQGARRGDTPAMLAMGQRLGVARRLLGRAKRWRRWLDAEVAINPGNASVYIQTARLFAGVAGAENIAISSLYLLAARATPLAACDEALELARAGTKLKRADVQRIIARHVDQAAGAQHADQAADPIRVYAKRLLCQVSVRDIEHLIEILQEYLQEQGTSADSR